MILFLLVLALGPLLHLLIGEFVSVLAYRWVLKRHDFEVEEPRQFWAAYYLFGLLLYLCLVLGLSSLGLPVYWSGLLAYLPAGLAYPRARYWIAAIRVQPSVNFALWMTVALILGTSLVSGVGEIQTPWRNNYGDLAWHIGMITSFTFGGNLPPMYHIFPGETLSYPFFINLWTSAIWSTLPNFTALSWVFCYQWLILWTLIYFALSGHRYRMLPWAVLLGGGSYFLVSRALGVEHGVDVSGLGPWAHDLIGKGFPWTPFLTTIWVCQRPAAFGAALLLTAMQLVHRSESLRTGEQDRNPHSWILFLAGGLLGLGPLVHTHIILAGVLYCGVLFCLSLGCEKKELRKARLRDYVLFALAGAPGLAFVPWLVGKSGISKIAGAWMQADVYEKLGLVSALGAGADLWWSNARVWLVLVLLFIMISKNFRFGAAFLVLFVFGNFVQLAVWNWDQLKFFVGLYLITLSWFAAGDRKGVWRLHWFFLLAILPAFAELCVNLKKYERFTVYSADEVELAEKVRDATSKVAIIAGSPGHNSLVTLTGRKLYYGYEGTLNSHGLSYLSRRDLQIDLNRLAKCRGQTGVPVCPDYLLWTKKESEYWHRGVPGSEFQTTSVPQLFRFPGGEP